MISLCERTTNKIIYKKGVIMQKSRFSLPIIVLAILAIGIFMHAFLSCQDDAPDTDNPYTNNNTTTTTTSGNDNTTTTNESNDPTTTTNQATGINYLIPLEITDVNYIIPDDTDTTLTPIDDVVQNLITNSTGGATGNGDSVTLTNKITGIVTLKDVYGHSTAQKCWFIQDKTNGIYVFDNTGVTADIGDEITVDVTAGKLYYNMIEITAYSNVSVISQNNPIYAEVLTSAQLESGDSYRGKFVVVENASIGTFDSYFVGGINGSTIASIHGSSAAETALEGNTAHVGGPVTFSYDKYRIEILNADQYSVQ
jgi:hypothetical protein